ncbi:MAG: TusE/DsrC/DsvC family sulfur relay protein [bacterium]|nr:TusE/DsrC/DsvC family sulfur relay protein [bacterium]
MPTFEYGRGRVELDDRGYLVEFDQWNDRVADALAAHDGIETLTEDHWHVIEFLREHQEEHGMAPMIRVLCKGVEMTLQRIYDLFPGGPAKGACRVAGLPRPDSCV